MHADLEAGTGSGEGWNGPGPLNVRAWNESCGWRHLSERECTELLGCCWVGVRGAGGGGQENKDAVHGGRCMRAVHRYLAVPTSLTSVE
jgi:hypothetical protein